VLGLAGFRVGSGTGSVCGADWDADGRLTIGSVCAIDSDGGKDGGLAANLVCAVDSDCDTDGDLGAADSDASGLETDCDAGGSAAGCNSEKLEIFVGIAVSDASAAVWRCCSFVGSECSIGFFALIAKEARTATPVDPRNTSAISSPI
jgi:hypothetical protein